MALDRLLALLARQFYVLVLFFSVLVILLRAAVKVGQLSGQLFTIKQYLID